MNKILYIILISLFSLTIISCSSSSDGGGGSSTGGSTDTIAPKIFESVRVVTPTNSSQSGTLQVKSVHSCKSYQIVIYIGHS